MKFYIIDRDAIEPKEHHIIFPFDFIDEIEYCSWLINLSYEEIKELEPCYYECRYFLKWGKPYDFEIDLWDFLKTKHTFIKRGNYLGGDEKGINIFELSNEDIIYMKLMDWIK